MTNIREGMPLFVRHEGEWQSRYTNIDPDGAVLDEYNVHIVCEFPDEENLAYHQTSTNTWSDGRTTQFIFGAQYNEKRNRITWDSGGLKGELWELDETTLYLTFTFDDIPNVYVCEMIQLSKCGKHRARTWHWFKDEQLTQRTLVKEHRLK